VYPRAAGHPPGMHSLTSGVRGSDLVRRRMPHMRAMPRSIRIASIVRLCRLCRCFRGSGGPSRHRFLGGTPQVPAVKAVGCQSFPPIEPDGSTRSPARSGRGRTAIAATALSASRHGPDGAARRSRRRPCSASRHGPDGAARRSRRRPCSASRHGPDGPARRSRQRPRSASLPRRRGLPRHIRRTPRSGPKIRFRARSRPCAHPSRRRACRRGR
jgi:hypothetical protein